jgi:hypothetical protein
MPLPLLFRGERIPLVKWLDGRLNHGLVFTSREIGARVASSTAGALVWDLTRRDDVGEWLETGP